uniref:F-box protein n=1 Tax=Noccaea caerulescens TaxID=107243 RepID=A0A1J3IW29_NOCCA
MKMMGKRNRKQASIAPQVVSLRGFNQIETAESLRIRRAVSERKKRSRGRGRDKRKILFPSDLMIEILTRLPAKSLMRFKCVSKQWSSFISGPYFTKLFLTATRQQAPRLFLSLAEEKGDENILLSSSTSPPNNTCFVVSQDLTIQKLPSLFYFNGLHGLICLSFTYREACVYNSTTGQLLRLPSINNSNMPQRRTTRYYIGHDPVSDQYKILCTIANFSGDLENMKSEHWVLLLEAGGVGGSWKKVESYHPHAPTSLGRSINGPVVHYLAWLDFHTCAVVSFDIRSEVFTTVPVPQPQEGERSAAEMKASLVEYCGKIAVFDNSCLIDKGSVDIWVLEDAGKKEWSNKTLLLQPCQRHLVDGILLIIKGTTRDGKVILAPWKMRSRFYILFYDMHSNELTKIEIKGVPKLWFDKEDCCYDFKFMDESESNICFKSI